MLNKVNKEKAIGNYYGNEVPGIKDPNTAEAFKVCTLLSSLKSFNLIAN